MQSSHSQISIAPMMGYTDRFCRYFLRQLSTRILLYTEMLTTGAILHGDVKRFLKYNPAEKPLALQIGGSNPKDCAQCASIAQEFGFDQINLNVGCPSDRVQKGKIGLCLMNHPELVAECVSEMKSVCHLPVTVKTRIGVDHEESFEFLHTFIEKQVQAGVDHITLHARKGWLKGLSPKENRTIPDLNYERVYAIKNAFEHLSLGINGGIETVTDARVHLEKVEEVMIGRAAVKNPYILATVDQDIYGDKKPIISREEVLARMEDFILCETALGASAKQINRHMLGLYFNQPGGRQFRRRLSDLNSRPL